MATNSQPEQTSEPQPKKQKVEEAVKYKKAKMAVLLMYSGHGYQGMQLNPKAKTIEQELHNAFEKSGAGLHFRLIPSLARQCS